MAGVSSTVVNCCSFWAWRGRISAGRLYAATQASESTGAGSQPAAAAGDLAQWRLGKVDPNWNGTFRATAWEDEGEMREVVVPHGQLLQI